MKVTQTEFDKIWSSVFAFNARNNGLESKLKDFFATVNEINRISPVKNRFMETSDKEQYSINDYEIATNWDAIILPYKVCGYASEYSLDIRDREYYNRDKADEFGKVMNPYQFKAFQTALFLANGISNITFTSVELKRTIETLDSVRNRFAVYKPINIVTKALSVFFERAHLGEFKVAHSDEAIWPIVCSVIFEEETQFVFDGQQMMIKYLSKVFN